MSSGATSDPDHGGPVVGDDAAADAPAVDGHIGRILDGKVRLDRLLGRGGMGDVYQGTHLSLGRQVAVKVIRDDMLWHPSGRERFQREAQVAARVSQSTDRIAQVFDFGTDDGAPGVAPVTYLVMEFVEGESLQHLSEQLGPLHWRTTLGMVHDVAEALSAAHAAGIVHRDLKPDNLQLLPPDEQQRRRVKVLDFGIARAAVVDDAEARKGLTAPGIVLGTPGYVAPEVMQGAAADGRADLFGVGAIWVRLLTGHDLYDGDSPRAVMLRQAAGVPDVSAELHTRGVPDDVIHVVAQLLHPDPEARVASADHLAQAVHQLAQNARQQASAPTPQPPQLSWSVPTSTSMAPAGTPATRSAPLPQAQPMTSTMPQVQLMTTSQPATPSSPNPWAMAFVALLTVVVGTGAYILGQQHQEAPPPQVIIRKLPEAATSPTFPTPTTTPPPAIAAAAAAPAVDKQPPARRKRRSTTKTAPPKKSTSTPKVATKAPTKNDDVAAHVDNDAKMSMAAPPPKLTSKVVKDIFRRHLGKASSCRNTNIKFSQSGPGLLIDHCPSYKSHDRAQKLTLTLDPSGKVTRAQFANAGVQRSDIGQCVIESLQAWTFPAFDGGPVDVTQRVEFEACVPINGVCVF